MTQPPTPRLALALVAAAALAACGGEPSAGAGQRFIAGIASVAPGVRPLAPGAAPATATTTVVGNDQVFAWAQLTYPDLFPGVPAAFDGVAYAGKVFSGRAYANGNYLAIANGEAYGLGPFTNQQLTNFGAVQGYAGLVCSLVDCGRSGALNACAPSTGETLRTETRLVTTHVATSLRPAGSPREITTESVVDGPASFAGQTAVRVTATQRDAFGASVGDGTLRSYLQAVDGGLIRTLGTETVLAAGGQTQRVSFDPALANSEFTLQPGASLTKVQTTSTSTVGAAAAPVTARRAVTYTFEARERIEVQGRSYETCRYREVALGTTAPVKITWAIVGSGLTARSETRDATGAVIERAELKTGTINGAPIAPGPATLDAAAAERLVGDYAYVLPICSRSGNAKAARSGLADAARRVLDLRKAARILAASQPRRHPLAYSATKPADQLGECGGRLSYPSYVHNNGVTTGTMRWEGYCSTDSDTGGTKLVDGSWSFVETATPSANGAVVTRYEGGSPGGISVVDKDAAGRTVGSQLLTVVGYVSTPGVPGGDATAAHPDRLEAAEWQVRNTLTGKVYRQTGYAISSFMTADGGEQTTISGRGYRSTGYYDLRTTTPLLTDGDGNYLSGVLTSTGADNSVVVMTVVPGGNLQATMTVGGQPVTAAPACQ